MSNFRKAFIFQIQILLTQTYSVLDMTLKEPYFVSTSICVQNKFFHFRLTFFLLYIWNSLLQSLPKSDFLSN